MGAELSHSLLGTFSHAKDFKNLQIFSYYLTPELRDRNTHLPLELDNNKIEVLLET